MDNVNGLHRPRQLTQHRMTGLISGKYVCVTLEHHLQEHLLLIDTQRHVH